MLSRSEFSSLCIGFIYFAVWADKSLLAITKIFLSIKRLVVNSSIMTTSKLSDFVDKCREFDKEFEEKLTQIDARLSKYEETGDNSSQEAQSSNISSINPLAQYTLRGMTMYDSSVQDTTAQVKKKVASKRYTSTPMIRNRK